MLLQKFIPGLEKLKVWGGDNKLLAWIGAVLGWTSIPFVILGSSIIGSIVGSIVAMKKQERL